MEVGVSVGRGEGVSGGVAVGVKVGIGVEAGMDWTGAGTPGSGMVSCPLMRMVACEITTAIPKMQARMSRMARTARKISSFGGRCERMYAQAASIVAVEPMRAAST